ncbi:MAG: hypothetical protein R6V41_14520 [Desulfobacteraceae bacterium]
MEQRETEPIKDNFENRIEQSYQKMSENIPQPPPDAFSRIMETIGEQQEKQVEEPQPSMLSRVMTAVRNIRPVPALGWSVAVVQFAVILFLIFQPQTNGTNGLKTLSIDGSADRSIVLNVVFEENAVQKDINRLLNRVEGVIVGGPGNNGVYLLKLRKGEDFVKRLNTIENSGVVKFAGEKY